VAWGGMARGVVMGSIGGHGRLGDKGRRHARHGGKCPILWFLVEALVALHGIALHEHALISDVCNYMCVIICVWMV
jgi:hypothetical protein